MASDRLVEQQIKDALASGALSPTRGIGEPFPKLDNDPAWWAKALLRREQAADRMGDVRASRAERVVAAVAAEELAQARAIVASLNQDVAAWNANVDEEYHLELVDEIWLLTEREKARR
jgi:hypothetical protein